jgi:DNA-binding transcriptional regulator LsrR (DeoR family)
MLQSLSPMHFPGAHVLPMIGALGTLLTQIHTTELTQQLASILGAQAYILPSPGIVDDLDTRQRLLADRQIKGILNDVTQADLAFVGVGNLRGPSSVLSSQLFSPEEIQELLDLGAIGDINLGYFDAQGHPVHGSIEKRLVGLTLQDLRSMKRVVAVAAGESKVEALLGALRGRYMQVLVTDHVTAQQLLTSAGEHSSQYDAGRDW